MTPRRVWTWLIFWVGVCVVVTALSWASYAVLDLEQRNAEARGMAQRQEIIQRALWRIDSRIAPVIALESSRPYTEYEQMQIDPNGWMRRAGETTTPPFSGSSGEQRASLARHYFQFDSSIATPNHPELAAELEEKLGIRSTQTVSQIPQEGVQNVDPLRSIDQSESFREKQTGYDYEARKAVADIALQNADPPPQMNTSESATEEVSSVAQTQQLDGLKDDADGKKREQIFQIGIESEMDDSGAMPNTPIENGFTPGTLTNRMGAKVGGFVPRWITDDAGVEQLVLVRTVQIEERSIVQGVLLDWPTLNAELLDAVDDIMPTGLIVSESSKLARDAYPLATIPAFFVPGGAVALPDQSMTPALIAMLMTWIAMVCSIAAIGVVLRAALNLSDRRGRFVTAVTHELRTPLTTFRLYSQMLADGMVPDDTVREQYLSTLKRESERLTGIVENVLEYARLSRRRSPKDKGAGVQQLTPDALLVRFRPALSRRADQSNMDLVTSIDLQSYADRTVTVDPNAVERIMMNLVENACKYAAPPPDLTPQAAEEFDTRIHLDVSVQGGMLGFLVADHGPGIESKDRGRVFGEFQRGSRRQVLDRSGLGLGLALSRGLAREMDGDLELVSRRHHGAEFLLTIPLDTPQSPSETPNSG